MKILNNKNTIHSNNPFTEKTVKLNKLTVEKIISLVERKVEKSRKQGKVAYTLGFAPNAEVLKELQARYHMKQMISIIPTKQGTVRYEDYAILLN